MFRKLCVASVSIALAGCFSDEPSANDVKNAYKPYVADILQRSRSFGGSVEDRMETFQFLGCKEHGAPGYVCSFKIQDYPGESANLRQVRMVKNTSGKWEGN